MCYKLNINIFIIKCWGKYILFIYSFIHLIISLFTFFVIFWLILYKREHYFIKFKIYHVLTKISKDWDCSIFQRSISQSRGSILSESSHKITEWGRCNRFVITLSSLLMASSISAILLFNLLSRVSISANPLTPELLFLSISDKSSSFAWATIKRHFCQNLQSSLAFKVAALVSTHRRTI